MQGTFHLCTEALKQALLCYDDEDYEILWNLMALTAWKCGVKVYCFCLMSNHLHLLAGSTPEILEDFFRNLVRKYSRYQSGKYGRMTVIGMTYKLLPVDSVRTFCNEVAYILRNPYKARLANPFSYQWSSMDAYFPKKKSDGPRVGDLTVREQRKIFHTKDPFPPNYRLDGNRIDVSSFVDGKAVEAAFGRSDIQFFDALRKWNLEDLVNESHGDAPIDMFGDNEVSEGIRSMCRDNFGCASIDGLDRKSVLRLVRKVANRYGCSRAQLMRLFSIDKDMLERLL